MSLPLPTLLLKYDNYQIFNIVKKSFLTFLNCWYKAISKFTNKSHFFLKKKFIKERVYNKSNKKFIRYRIHKTLFFEYNKIKENENTYSESCHWRLLNLLLLRWAIGFRIRSSCKKSTHIECLMTCNNKNFYNLTKYFNNTKIKKYI